MGSIQNQEQTQDTHQLKSGIKAQYERETQQKQQIHSSIEKKIEEKQSMSLSRSFSFYQEEPMTWTDRVEERESKEKNSGTGSGGAGGPRERLKRHRTEVAGHVWIPDMWGQEELLKDWIDCNAFDACLVPKGLMSARASLIQEGRRANSGSITVENSC